MAANIRMLVVINRTVVAKRALGPSRIVTNVRDSGGRCSTVHERKRGDGRDQVSVAIRENRKVRAQR